MSAYPTCSPSATHPNTHETMSLLYPSLATVKPSAYPPIYVAHAQLNREDTPRPYRHVAPSSTTAPRPSTAFTSPLFETNARSNLLGDLIYIFGGSTSSALAKIRNSVPVSARKRTRSPPTKRRISEPMPTCFKHVSSSASMVSSVYSTSSDEAPSVSTDISFAALTPTYATYRSTTPPSRPDFLPPTPAATPERLPRARGVLRKQRSRSWEARALDGWCQGDVLVGAEQGEEAAGVPSWYACDDAAWQEESEDDDEEWESGSRDRWNGNWV